MNKQWAVKLLFIIFAILTWKVNAANYQSSVTTGSYANGIVTVSGFVNYNPNGVGVPDSGLICHGTVQCKYGPGVAYRYKVISGGNSYLFTTTAHPIDSLSEVAYKNPNQQSGDTRDYTLLADALKNKLGTAIAVSGRILTIQFGPNHILQDVGICMTAIGWPSLVNAGNDNSSCSWIKPTISCSVQNSLTLDHGNLLLGNVNGNKKSGYVNVTCSGALSAKVFPIMDTINLGSGLESKITVNGKSTEQTIPLTAGSNSISVESTLVDSGAKAGSFQGSTTLIVSFQ